MFGIGKLDVISAALQVTLEGKVADSAPPTGYMYC